MAERILDWEKLRAEGDYDPENRIYPNRPVLELLQEHYDVPALVGEHQYKLWSTVPTAVFWYGVASVLDSLMEAEEKGTSLLGGIFVNVDFSPDSTE